VSLPPGARDARAVGGGYINETFRVVLAGGREAFVKTRADAARGEFAAEAAGLEWLAQAGALRTPAVLGVEDGYLALEWIAPGQLDAAGEQELGRGLALTHAAGAPRFGRFAEWSGGVERGSAGEPAAWRDAAPDPEATSSPKTVPDLDATCDPDTAPGPGTGADLDAAWLGSLRVSNEPTGGWPAFYADRRLRPLAALALDRAAVSHGAIEAVERICERIDDLAGPREPPARLHGDLWSGNVHADADGRPWLIDPSAFGGHREVDLAMLALFGGLSARVLGSYEEVTPLADGWKERVGLYELLPLLVHAILFGGSYGEAVERTARRYAG
jgi:fructosamine-3-kinase